MRPWFAIWLGMVPALSLWGADTETSPELTRWLGPQSWRRDGDQPVLGLGKPGEFDDTHLFAPTVAWEQDQFWMWYCGSRGQAHDLAPQRVPDERAFRLGLATSADGRAFRRHPGGPVMTLAEDQLSLVTPCLVKQADGTPRREQGQLRMFFAVTRHRNGQTPALHEATSSDGVHWSRESEPLLPRVYAPCVLHTDRGYEMWYTEPGRYPWLVRYAQSQDGRAWQVRPEPVLTMTQPWEHFVLIYPAVMKVDGVYLLWYASYLGEDRQTTGIGYAVSLDGVQWTKHPHNPVLRPDPQRPWESHYVSSHSLTYRQGTFRMWYASRKAPPFTNLYFALNTAVWEGPSP